MDYKKQVDKMASRYKNLLGQGYTDNQAHERVMFENGNINSDLVSYATERYLDNYQLDFVYKKIKK